MATWMNPIRFLKKHPAVLEARRHNDLIPKGGDRPWMLSGSGRALWQSAVLLVFINKLRGHDISRGLFVENLQVSPSGSFRLKNPISDAWYKGKSFMGYKALAALFNALMKEIYGPSVVSELSADVEHWLSTLEGPLDDRLCLYHAALLSRSGRSMLSIRAHSLVRSEVNPEGFCWIRPQIYDFLLNLPYVSLDHMTDKMHVFFRHLRQHGERKKAEAAAEAATKQLTKCSQEFDQDARKKSPTETPHELSDEEALRQAGFSVVALNRNAVMHRIWPDDVKTLVQDLPDAAVKEWYCLWEIVQLLDYYMPLYLPEVQRGAIKCRFWKYLEMGAFWPRDEMFHNGTPMRIGLADNMFGMLTYRSSIGDGPNPLLGGHYAHPQTFDAYAWAMGAIRCKEPFAGQVKEGLLPEAMNSPHKQPFAGQAMGGSLPGATNSPLKQPFEDGVKRGLNSPQSPKLICSVC